MEYEDFLELIQNIRSIRRFKPDPIPDDYVEKIIEAARWAPSGFNQQPWDFVVVKNPEYRNKIANWYSEYVIQSRLMETTRESWQKAWNPEPTGSEADYSIAPVYIILLGDTRTKEGLPMAVRYNPYRQEYIFTASLTNAFLYMHMAASTLGLASQYISGVASPYVQCLTKDLLGIPKEYDIYDMLVVGYPAVRTRPKLLRDKDLMVHYDHSEPGSFRTGEEVKDFIRKARTWTMASHARQADK
jgi:nitroreductase